jgi:precorrin-6B methylase 2
MSPTKFDFVYIDGGHSYDTVKHDYSMVKDSTLIVFDDVKITAINVFIKELIAEGVDVEIVRTESKHTWAVIRN